MLLFAVLPCEHAQLVSSPQVKGDGQAYLSACPLQLSSLQLTLIRVAALQPAVSAHTPDPAPPHALPAPPGRTVPASPAMPCALCARQVCSSLRAPIVTPALRVFKTPVLVSSDPHCVPNYMTVTGRDLACSCSNALTGLRGACGAGYYAPDTGASACSPCGAGTYASGSGATSCTGEPRSSPPRALVSSLFRRLQLCWPLTSAQCRCASHGQSPGF